MILHYVLIHEPRNERSCTFFFTTVALSMSNQIGTFGAKNADSRLQVKRIQIKVGGKVTQLQLFLIWKHLFRGCETGCINSRKIRSDQINCPQKTRVNDCRILSQRGPLSRKQSYLSRQFSTRFKSFVMLASRT